MREKAEIPVNLLSDGDATPLIEAWYEIVHLKQLYRQGWILRGMAPSECETVAEHSFGNAMLCLLLLARHPELDALKVLKLALLHDLGEAYVGDITPQDRIEKADKNRLESDAVHKILAKIPGGETLIEDWLEYEHQQTEEARFVKQIDRLELAMQASVYHSQGKVDPAEFHEAARKHLTSGELISELEALMSL
ncbi:MAG: HD domain-containing protein [Gammaproteobacteria bacterium]|nr:HD domain-containing protein [Gammaproteobacteria bacterium]